MMNVTEQTKLPVSVFIVAQNEESNITRLMRSLTHFDEVVVVDSGSTDDTPAIARQHGAKVFHQTWLGFAAQKQWAMEQCKNDWVLNLDADEVVTAEMFKAIAEVIKDANVDAVRFNRNDLFLGKMPPKWMKKPNNVRLYRRAKAKFDTTQKVHESARVDGREIHVKASFDHYGYNDIATLVLKFNHYSSLKAKEKYQRGKRGSLIKLSLICAIEFWRKYLLQRHFTFGVRGFILSILNAHYAFLKEAKLLSESKNK
ncbi:glycosyltransferase family 2 protein [Alteromonas sp. ASW11-19]|uniref:Glycosyltransferase family 2 protein n=1 Tax=Alteromonas salexigens TaxID=2982530 RepID=A0ABT2VSH4_9ALTE|nr:glycosyltransferase family 2 protein [Alteromonas salexigens]MCU7554819.1 glycosyltransferase family 2 protein [Alteromonas salexigens]